MEAVLAATVAGSFTVVVTLIQKARKENREDHGTVVSHMQMVSNEIRKDLRQVRYEIRDHRNELREHIRKDHYASDIIPIKEQEAG